MILDQKIYVRLICKWILTIPDDFRELVFHPIEIGWSGPENRKCGYWKKYYLDTSQYAKRMEAQPILANI
jgi:hypothetical protein